MDAFASLADFAPTLLDAAGIHPGQPLAGQSLLPFLEKPAARCVARGVFTQCNGVELYYSQRSVMTKRYKYTFNGFDQDELYDLAADPHEMINRAEDADYQEIKKELCRRLWQFAYEQGDSMINPYITVGLAPWGPGVAFR